MNTHENHPPIKDLSLLKAQRLIKAQQIRERSFWKRGFDRYMETYQAYVKAKHTPPIAFIYATKEIFTKVWFKISAVIIRSPRLKSSQDKLGHKIVYAVSIPGGIGDALMTARFIRDLQAELSEDVQFDIYFHTPKLIGSFFNKIPGFRNCVAKEKFHANLPTYAFALITKQFVTFLNDYIHPDIGVYHPKIVECFNHIQAAKKNIGEYIQSGSMLKGALADLLAPQGKKRYTYLHEMMGLNYGGDRLPLEVDSQICAQYGLTPGNYLTIHDGWDNQSLLPNQRATKAVPLQKWVEIIRLLKQAKPDLMIVQLGGKVGDVIPGVDLCLKEKLNFDQSTSILAHALLHLDAESGLVHLGTALGVRSVVMFGPTSLEWFSYPQNANIAPKQCGNCWGVTDSWMTECPIGYTTPICMASIVPQEVVDATLDMLLLPRTN